MKTRLVCMLNMTDVMTGPRGDPPTPSLPCWDVGDQIDECPLDSYSGDEGGDCDDEFVNPWADLVTEDDFNQALTAQGSMEMWEAPGVCVLEDMDDNMGEFKDIELITANKGWIQCEHPPIVRFDHEQMQWQQTAAKHHLQHQQDMDVLDAWAEAGFDEG